MTEEKRYYTPTEGEFRVGFEYEEFVKGEGWVPRTLSSLSEDPTLNQKGFCIDFPYDFRVKCLDKEDIEAEGWKESNIMNIPKCTEFTHAYPNNQADFFHIYNTSEQFYGSNNWCIRLKQGKNWFTIFSGQILNRSELKFQMKRLGIV